MTAIDAVPVDPVVHAAIGRTRAVLLGAGPAVSVVGRVHGAIVLALVRVGPPVAQVVRAEIVAVRAGHAVTAPASAVAHVAIAPASAGVVSAGAVLAAVARAAVLVVVALVAVPAADARVVAPAASVAAARVGLVVTVRVSADRCRRADQVGWSRGLPATTVVPAIADREARRAAGGPTVLGEGEVTVGRAATRGEQEQEREPEKAEDRRSGTIRAGLLAEPSRPTTF